MVALLIALAVLIVVLAAELLHARRTQRVARLAFGPSERPRGWVYVAPWLKGLAVGAMVWGLITLLGLEPKVHKATEVPESEMKHLVILLDVSPSMLLEDAGPERNLSRRKRAHAVMQSFFERVQLPEYRTSIIAVYNGAKPVVIDTKDREVVDNILADLPMHYAFKAGNTELFTGLEEVVNIVKDFPPKSTVLMLISDGDTVPASGMPKMPRSVEDVLVIGVGDPLKGVFFNGRQSRQDASTLRQLAIRMGGTYHDGNTKQLSTTLIRSLAKAETKSVFEKLSIREYALVAIGTGAAVYAFLPLLLHFFGTPWRPGVFPTRRGSLRSELTPGNKIRHPQPTPL
jgi:Ca-activated chloride channel family protein